MQLRVQHTAPANLSYPYVDGSLSYGDVFEVDAEKGDALLDTHDYLEAVVDVEGGVVESDDYDDYTYDELYEIAGEYDIDGRSSMTKAELIDALREYED